MIKTALTSLAFSIASEAHDGQRDKAGMPYIFHPMHIAEQMPDEISTAVALLHDVLEDSEYTVDELRACGIPQEVLSSVVALTRPKEGCSYVEYIRDRVAKDPVAVVVKKPISNTIWI